MDWLVLKNALNVRNQQKYITVFLTCYLAYKGLDHGFIGMLIYAGLGYAAGQYGIPKGLDKLEEYMAKTPADKPNESTIVIYSDLRFDVEVPDSTFSLQQLRRRK